MFENTAEHSRLMSFLAAARQRPNAAASVRGSDRFPGINGTVRFFQTTYGVLVTAEIFGLPAPEGACKSPVFAFHIHSGESCTGNSSDPFADAMAHYNPGGCMHPQHAGDMPPLFGNGGYAFQMFLTQRFSVNEIIGKTVIIHSNPDDFKTQPSGDSGEKIACGQIAAFSAR